MEHGACAKNYMAGAFYTDVCGAFLHLYFVIPSEADAGNVIDKRENLGSKKCLGAGREDVNFRGAWKRPSGHC